MYLPAHFTETELPVLHAQMEGTRLAMVVTSGQPFTFASAF
jgi:predicted FMN-binding regulatory protein PaiB